MFEFKFCEDANSLFLNEVKVDVYLVPHQTSITKIFSQKRTILDIWWGPKYASDSDREHENFFNKVPYLIADAFYNRSIILIAIHKNIKLHSLVTQFFLFKVILPSSYITHQRPNEGHEKLGS